MGLQSSFPRPVRSGSDSYQINVFDIAGFVSRLESFGIGLRDAVKYSMNGKLFTLALEDRSDVVLFTYNKKPQHGLLEIYWMATPENLDDIVRRLVDSVEGANHVRG